MALKIPVRQSPATDNGDSAAMSAGTRSISRASTSARSSSSRPNSQFILSRNAIKRRAIVNIQGPEKSGKDHMALDYTGGPIYIHSFDIGLEGVVQKFHDKKDIYVCEYELTIQPGDGTDKEVGEAANVVWENFVGNFRESLAQTTDNEGLVIVDTGTEAWELLRLASFGKLTQVMPHHYSKPNAEFRNLLRESFSGSSVCWLHKMMPEWENYVDHSGKEKGRKTGLIVRKGMGDVAFAVQVNVETTRIDRAGGGSDFQATVIDCRVNPDLNGMVLPNSMDSLLEMVLM
jgi:hypothetical protein